MSNDNYDSINDINHKLDNVNLLQKSIKELAYKFTEDLSGTDLDPEKVEPFVKAFFQLEYLADLSMERITELHEDINALI